LNLSESIQETVDMSGYQPEDRVVISMQAESAMAPIDPLFNKPTYDKRIEFNIEFSLK
jgi:hypothetical protein